MTASRLRLGAAAAVFLLLLLVRPLSIALLRRGGAGGAATDGRFELLLPELAGTRYRDESTYAARVKQVLDRGVPYSPYLRERRAVGDWIYNFLEFYLMAPFAAAAGGNLTRGWILAVAAVAAAWFWLLSGLFKWWCGREDLAVPLALFAVLFPDVAFFLLDINFSPAVNARRYSEALFQVGAMIRPHFYRLPSPWLTYLLVGLLLAGAWRLAVSARIRPWAAAALGAAFAAMVFVHAFEHIFGVAVLCSFTALLWLARRPREGRYNAAIAAAAAVLLSAAAAALVNRLEDPEARRQMWELAGLEHTRRFYLITLIHPLVAALFAWWASREKQPGRQACWLLLAAAQLAGFACRNAQVIVGQTIQPFHFIPLISCAGAFGLALAAAGALAARWSRTLGIAVSAGLLLWACANEALAARRTYRLFGLPSEIQGGLDWLRDNAPDQSLVLSLSMEVNEDAALFTRSYVQVPPISAPFSALFTREGYLERVASLLKTAHADPDRFIAERWPLPAKKSEAMGRLIEAQQKRGEADLADLEAVEWFYGWYHGRWDDAPVLEGRRRLRELFDSAREVDPPYFLWVGAADERLLASTPGKRGGRLVYSNPGVRLYRFDPVR